MKIHRLMKVALTAPCSFGHRPVEFVIIRDKNRIKDLAACKSLGGSQIIGADGIGGKHAGAGTAAGTGALLAFAQTFIVDDAGFIRTDGFKHLRETGFPLVHSAGQHRTAGAYDSRDILAAGREVERHIHSNQDRTEADQAFHKKIAIASHNRFMLQLLPIVHSAVSETILLNEKQEQLSEETRKDHAQIMNFLKARDPEGARAAMTIHLRNAMNLLNL